MANRAGRGCAEIRSVGRALDLLEVMQLAAPAGIRVSDAAAHLGVDPATVSRLLSTLRAHGYATRTADRRYTLGVRSLRLATGWVDRVLQVAAPTMARVAESCGETVHLLQLVGSEAVTLARLAGNRRAMIDVEVGATYPLWATAAGRALLASVPEVARPTLLPPEPFPAFTGRTRTSWTALATALREARKTGIYVEEEEVAPHYSCYAIPLLHRNRDEKLAVAISFETARPERDRRFLRQALRQEWRELAAQI